MTIPRIGKSIRASLQEGVLYPPAYVFWTLVITKVRSVKGSFRPYMAPSKFLGVNHAQCVPIQLHEASLICLVDVPVFGVGKVIVNRANWTKNGGRTHVLVVNGVDAVLDIKFTLLNHVLSVHKQYHITLFEVDKECVGGNHPLQPRKISSLALQFFVW